jgi:hypothetical protein
MSAMNPLPPIRWTNGSVPTLPIDYSKQVEKAGMLSGGQRFNIKSKHPRSWPLTWQMLTTAEFAVLAGLNALNRELYFQNNWEDATWHEVVITKFEPEAVLNLGPTTCRWNLSMRLEEAKV